MSNIRIDMPSDVAHIIDILEQNGHEAFAVGGCVRDAIMGRIPHDWDITTSAKPHQVKALFRRTIDTGIQHGTVTIMIGSTGYEVTTYRIDGTYSDGRHPEEVTFTTNLVEDLKRRDFTINAMAYNNRAGVIDEFNGIDDLNNGIIRCVGEAAERFTEDALRILRAIRFSAQLNFSIDEATANAITLIAPNLKKISRERIQTELDKLITSAHPDRITLVQAYGLTPYIFDNADILLDNNITVYNNIAELMNELPQNHFLRWSAITVLENNPQAVLKGLKFDNNTIDVCKKLHAISRLNLPTDKPYLRRLIVKFGKELFDDYVFTFLKVLHQNHISELDVNMKKSPMNTGCPEIPSIDITSIDEVHGLYNEIISNGDCISMKDMAVKGADLMAIGMAPGKQLGTVLNNLFQQVLDDPSLNDKDMLLKMAEQMM